MSADLKHTGNKTDKQFLFETHLQWVEGMKGALHTKKVQETIHVETPLEFGGSGKYWSPEHLLLNAVNSCYMSTYLHFAKKMGFEIIHFECNAIGQVELVDGRYKFTNINLFPKIYIEKEEIREKAAITVEKTHKHCLVTNSLNATVFYHPELLVGKSVAVAEKREEVLVSK
jgi:peroxiredoxin-like protein